jgi:hypothetical protein
MMLSGLADEHVLPIGDAIRRILDYALHTDPADAANVVKYL